MSDALRAALLEKAMREKRRRTQSNGEVVFSDKKGGRVMRRPDGALSYTSPGYSTNDPERISQIMGGASPVKLLQDTLDRERIGANPVAAHAQEFTQGAPFVGEWLDEGVGMISPKAAQNMRAASDAMERQHPIRSGALNVAGALATAAPIVAGGAGGKAADFIAKGGSALARGGRAAAVAAPAGAVEGAVAFSGRADPGDRGSEAFKGGAIGAGLGAALGPFAMFIGDGAAALAKRFKRVDVHTISDEFGISIESARAVKQALLNDDLAAASARLQSLGDDALLADAGPSTGALLDAAANSGGVALRVAHQAVNKRANVVGARLTAVLDGVLGKPKGVKTAAREISQGTATARQRAYDAAFAQPIDYAAQSGRKIEGVIDRIPSKTLSKAVQEANEAMQEAGLRNQQIMAQIGDDGSVRFVQMPDVRQLDFLKRALDDVARAEVDQFGRATGAGLRARRLARDLRNAVRDSVPEYAYALRLGGDKIQQDEGLALGKSLLFRGTTTEDVKAFLRQGVSSEAKQAVHQGLRDSIEQTLSNVRRTITDPEVDAREAMALVKEMSSRANISKVRMIIGGARADRLFQELDRTATALQLRAAISQNSKTAIRQGIQGQMAAEVQPSLLRRTIGRAGNPLDAAKEVTETLLGIDTRSMSAKEKAMLDEIAQALVGIKGQDASKAMFAVRRAMAGQPLKDDQAKLIGRLAAGTIGLGAYQSAKQFLEPR